MFGPSRSRHRARRPPRQLTDDAAALLVKFITTQHRGVHKNNLRRRDEIAALLSARRELLNKRTAERLLRLGQACVDDSATAEYGDSIDFKSLLRVATEALNTLMLVLVEGEDALGRLSSTGPDKRLLDRYLRLEFATLLIVAGHPDRCAHFLPHVPYGDVRDEPVRRPTGASGGALSALGPWMLMATLAVAIWMQFRWRQQKTLEVVPDGDVLTTQTQ